MPSARTQPGQVHIGAQLNPERNEHELRHRSNHSDPSVLERGGAASSYLYYGSFLRSSAKSTPAASGLATPKSNVGLHATLSQQQLQVLLEKLDVENINTYGLEEGRDGFFDAVFYRQISNNDDSKSEVTAKKPTNVNIVMREWLKRRGRSLIHVMHRTIMSHTRIAVLKSFLAFIIAYILCLIPQCRNWLGRFSYFLPLAVIFNHPGRTFGAQVEGTVLCITGVATGLAWSSLALYTSTSTSKARVGYGGILSAFFAGGMILSGYLRAVTVRLYQGVISANVVMIFMMCYHVEEVATWRKAFDIGVPWTLGITLALVINIAIFPDAGSRRISLAIHSAIYAALEALPLTSILDDAGSYSPSKQDRLRRNMTRQIVNLSEAHRDMRMEITRSAFDHGDVEELRNRLQSLIRSLISIDSRQNFGLFDTGHEDSRNSNRNGQNHNDDYDSSVNSTPSSSDGTEMQVFKTSPPVIDASIEPLEEKRAQVKVKLETPAKSLIDNIVAVLLSCDAKLMKYAGHGDLAQLEQSSNETLSVDSRAIQTLSQSQEQLTRCLSNFDAVDAALLHDADLLDALAESKIQQPVLAEVFLFLHPIRRTAGLAAAFAEKVMEITENEGPRKVQMPSYSLRRMLVRSNPQVRHDRGGRTALSYFRSMAQVQAMMNEFGATKYVPLDKKPTTDVTAEEDNHRTISNRTMRRMTTGVYVQDWGSTEAETVAHRIWRILHWMQMFESRFALKLCVAATLVAIPGWLPQSRVWWNDYECWWIIYALVVMMHPRVGGNLQDLITRSFATCLGAIWGGLAYAARQGNPFVMATFALLFMYPAIYRFTSSAHPRSGYMACISFTIVSLSARTLAPLNHFTETQIAWTRGCALLAGVWAAVLVNWIIWPFVARHELRKSIAHNMLHLAFLYRRIIAKYIYYDNAPTARDVRDSEILDGRLREGYVRIRELRDMATHEIRLRGPLDLTPYDALIRTQERVFEYLVKIRQSSLYFNPLLRRVDRDIIDPMTLRRRDAVASVLMILYVLSGALRAKRPLPRYLPSAAAARKRLLDSIQESEVENGKTELYTDAIPGNLASRRWADVYRYAYSSALTDIVQQLDELHMHTKAITGEIPLVDLT